MAISTSTDVAAVIETRVSTIVPETLIQEAVMMMAVKDYSAEIGPGMDQLDIPLFNELAVQSVTEGTDLTPQTINPAQASLVLDRQRAIPFAITDRGSIQAKARLVDEAVKNGARSLAAEIDDDMIGLAVANAANNIATTASPLADMANAKALLDAANVPKFDRFAVCSPGFVQALLGDNNIIRANEYGATSPIQAGQFGNIYGFTLLESSSSGLANDGFIAMQRDALAFGRQIQPKFERERRVLGLKDDYVLSHLYGGIATDSSGVRVVDYTA
jgi:hypothetical protein